MPEIVLTRGPAYVRDPVTGLRFPLGVPVDITQEDATRLEALADVAGLHFEVYPPDPPAVPVGLPPVVDPNPAPAVPAGLVPTETAPAPAVAEE
jgi:hypothetical protein